MRRWETALMRVKRGEIWLVDFEPQTHKAEPGKRARPALVLQTDLLNNANHRTTIVIPGTTQIYRDEQGDAYPLRISLSQNLGLPQNTDLLIDQIRAIANERFMGGEPMTTLSANHMKRVLDALAVLTR